MNDCMIPKIGNLWTSTDQEKNTTGKQFDTNVFSSLLLLHLAIQKHHLDYNWEYSLSCHGGISATGSYHNSHNLTLWHFNPLARHLKIKEVGYMDHASNWLSLNEGYINTLEGHTPTSSQNINSCPPWWPPAVSVWPPHSWTRPATPTATST